MKRVIFLALFVLPACKNENELSEVPYEEPELSLADPAAASWQSAGTVTATGVARNLTDVKVNGVGADVDGDSYSASVTLERGINVLEVTGKDGRGDTKFVRQAVIAGDYNDPGQKIEDAASLRLNQGGIDAALAQVGSLLTPDSIRSMVMNGQPLYQDSYGIWGWDAVTVNAIATQLEFDTPDLTANPNDGVLELDATIPNVQVGVNVYGEIIGIDYDVDIWVWADPEIEAELGVGADDGMLTVSIVDTTIDLVGFGYDTSLLPGDIEQYILVDTIASFLETKLMDAVETMVPPLLEEQLASLDLSFETEVLDRQVSIAADISDAYIDDDGIVAVVDLDVDMPSAGSMEYAGYLAATPGAADTDRNADVGVSLSDNLLNRVLFEAWRAGVLEMTMSTADGSLPEMMLTQLHATEGSVAISAKLPPVAIQKDGGLLAQLGEVEVVIDTPGGEMGDHLKVALAASVPLNITVENGELKLSLGELDMDMVVRESDWGASNETITRLLEEMLPINALLALFGNFSFPLPAIGPLTIDSADVARESTGAFTGVGIELGY